MDTKAASSNRSYEDFEPFCKWHPKEEQYILDIRLNGFKKEQLKVQVNNRGILTIYGERPLDASRWSRFHKEVNLPKDGVADEIQAKFSQTNGILFIVLPIKVQSLTIFGVKISKRRAMTVAVVVAVVVMVVAIGTQIAQLVHRDPRQHHAASNDHVVNV